MDSDDASPVYNQLKSLLFVDSNTDQQSPQQLNVEEDELWGLTKQQLLEWSQEHSAARASASVNVASPLEGNVDVGGTCSSDLAKCTSSSLEQAAAGTSKRRSGGGSNCKFSTDPQSVAARLRRKRISERFKTLQKLVPGGTKMDTASMLDEAITYVKFLKQQIWLHELAANGGVPASTSTSTSMTTTRVPAIKYDPSSLEAEEAVKGWNDRDDCF